MIKTIPQTRHMLYLVIGSRMNRCIRTLITAFTSQINGGKGMTPGLSSGLTAFNARQFIQMRLACFAFLGITIFTLSFGARAEEKPIMKTIVVLEEGAPGVLKF